MVKITHIGEYHQYWNSHQFSRVFASTDLFVENKAVVSTQSTGWLKAKVKINTNKPILFFVLIINPIHPSYFRCSTSPSTHSTTQTKPLHIEGSVRGIIAQKCIQF
eukprot:TRINITY_DN1495_c0_g1_i5.p1 TRINITY_DN1495_c0_g1~~TRINITY_DN1495_c0_g1_i5.p1  ORF type:complete len:106 (-),score=27.34 TRINITY_DN1495_c0_g1_i5:749-1066(-)